MAGYLWMGGMEFVSLSRMLPTDRDFYSSTAVLLFTLKLPPRSWKGGNRYRVGISNQQQKFTFLPLHVILPFPLA